MILNNDVNDTGLQKCKFWLCAMTIEETFLFFKKKYCFYVLVALGLRCCWRAFSSCGEQGYASPVVHGLPLVVASLVAKHRL